MTLPRSRRKHYFIKKAFQAHFFLRFGVLIFLEALLIAGLFLFVASGTLTTGYEGAQLRIEKTSSFFLTSFVLISLIVGIAMALVGMLAFVFLSHRIAGPLYRFEKSLEEMGKGNLAHRINLRRTDQLGDLARTFNQSAERMEERVSDLKRKVHEVVRLSSAKDQQPETSSKLRQNLNDLKETVDSFQTSS